MTWTIYLALGAGFLAVAGATVFLVVRVLEAWRALKRLRRHLGKELDRVVTLAEQTAESAARASDQTTLEQSLSRLRAALAQLAVLRGAVDEATATFGRFTALYPRK
jgi:ATP/maltotriose-dependent transcriptional regulator MalT